MTNEHNKFTDFILPKKTRDLKFNETIELLKELFNPRLSIFYKIWKCLNIPKNESEDFTTYASVINKTCDDNFKCLIFVLGLVSRKDSDMRRRILTKLDNEQNMSLQKLADYCQQHVNIKQESQKNKQKKQIKTMKKNHPPSACNGCGQFHWYKECPDKYKIWRNCNRKGHKMSCSKKIKQSRVKITQIDNQEQNIRKYLYVKNPNQEGKNATRIGLRHLCHKHSDLEKYWETNTP